jgi:hypothetical protein
MNDQPISPHLDAGVEFSCMDCGAIVHRFWMFADEPKRCFVCRFIRDAAEPDRQELRTHLWDLQALNYWNQVGCYRDEACQERPCDHCGTSYRGPGVFCCQRCALAEAV